MNAAATATYLGIAVFLLSLAHIPDDDFGVGRVFASAFGALCIAMAFMYATEWTS